MAQKNSAIILSRVAFLIKTMENRLLEVGDKVYYRISSWHSGKDYYATVERVTKAQATLDNGHRLQRVFKYGGYPLIGEYGRAELLDKGEWEQRKSEYNAKMKELQRRRVISQWFKEFAFPFEVQEELYNRFNK